MKARDCYIITTEQAQNRAGLIVKMLNKHGIDGKITSTPKEFSGKSCAYCVKIPQDAAMKAENIVKSSSIKAMVVCR